MSPTRKTRAIPFIALFARGGEARMRRRLKDPTISPELRAVIERYLADPAAAAALDQEQLLAESDKRAVAALGELAKHRSGKPRGALKRSTSYVHALALHPEHAGLPAKILWKLADKKKLGRMSENTFRDHVSNARRGK